MIRFLLKRFLNFAPSAFIFWKVWYLESIRNIFIYYQNRPHITKYLIKAQMQPAEGIKMKAAVVLEYGEHNPKV